MELIAGVVDASKVNWLFVAKPIEFIERIDNVGRQRFRGAQDYSDAGPLRKCDRCFWSKDAMIEYRGYRSGHGLPQVEIGDDMSYST
jgi:hypothetical protein